jgi:hypothetical protein
MNEIRICATTSSPDSSQQQTSGKNQTSPRSHPQPSSSPLLSGEKAPVFTPEAFANSTALCGTFSYGK